MPTVTRSRPSAKPRKADLVVSLCLAIDHTPNTLNPIRPQNPDVSRAWRLEKKGGDGAVYDVAATIHGHVCDCPDFETRRNGLDPAGCKHIRACVVMGLLEDVASVATSPVEPTPAHDVPWWEQERKCDVCNKVGKGRADRADGILICRPCSKREDEEATYKAFLAAPAPVVAPAPCCSPSEPTACLPCQTTTPATDSATAILDRGLALAEAIVNDSEVVSEVVNEPVTLPDAYADEPLELPVSEPYDPTPEDEAAYDAMIAQRHLDTSAVLTLPEAIDHVTDAFRAWGSPFGEMIARAMDELALKCRMTDATTPAEFADRVETLEAEVRAGWEKIGRESVTKPLTDIDDWSVRRGKPTSGCAHGNYAPSTSPYCQY